LPGGKVERNALRKDRGNETAGETGDEA
jgi:hypothetical protein